ncbi:hypothetical protein ACHAXR_007162 [Thalassiosira sp. AJA248-18]
MNMSSIDALAEAALTRDSPVAPSSLSPSFLKAGDVELTGAAMAARRLSILSTGSQGLTSGVGSTGDHSIFLSIFNEQRRRSMTGFNSTIAPTMATSPTVGSTAPQAQATHSGDIQSAANNYASMVQTQFDSTVTAPSRRRKPNFAEKLHAVLNNKNCRHAIAWLPSGRSFCITDQEEFVKKILPDYFREAKFESFSRRLKRWGFRKVYTTGLSQIIFSHDMFHRDRADLCRIMNGREKVAAPEDSQGMAAGAAGPAGQFVAQEQLRNVMMLQQQQQQLQQRASFQQMQQLNQQRAAMLVAAQQQGQGHSSSSLGSVQSNPNVLRGVSSSPERADAQAVISEAQAIVARSMPRTQGANSKPNPIPMMNTQDPGTMQEAKMQLTRLNADIANCETQLMILQNLKELKAKRRQLTGASSPRGVSPSSAEASLSN